MKVSRWGNSLAIRLNAQALALLGVAEGDEVVVERSTDRTDAVTLRRAMSVEEMRDRLDKIRATVSLPEGWKFDREEANSRD